MCELSPTTQVHKDAGFSDVGPTSRKIPFSDGLRRWVAASSPRRWATSLALIASLLPSGAVLAQRCVGDCDSNSQVTVDEILKSVNIALGATSASACTAADDNGDASVTVDEILNAVTAALRGCSTTAGVCGLSVTSVPRICGLEVVPNPVLETGTVIVRVSVADLEGDVVQLCLGYAESGLTPIVECQPIEPGSSTVNGTFDFGPFAAPPAGTYSGLIRFIDSAGNRSNDLSIEFVVLPDTSAQALFLYGGDDFATFLGCLTCPATARDSVFNEFGPYGSEFSTTSIWNQFGSFGSDFTNTSICNRFATDPPGVFDSDGDFYGRLTQNTLHPQALRDQASVDLVTTVCGTR